MRRQRAVETYALKKVAIVGASVGGLTLARALQVLPSCVRHVKVFERNPGIQPFPGMTCAMNGGAMVLSQLGLGQEMAQILNPLQRLKIRSSGKEVFKLDLADYPQFRSPEWTSSGQTLVGQCMRKSLKQSLAASLAPDTISFGKQLVNIDEIDNGPTLFFADGSSESADLVIGADGVHSVVRRLVFGPSEPQFAGFRLLYAISEGSTRASCGELVLDWQEGRYWGIHTAGGDSDRHDLIFLTERLAEPRTDTWRRVYSANAIRELTCEAEREDCPNPPDEVFPILARSRRCIDQDVYVHPEMDSWRQGSVVLIGEACHPTAAFLGQGANQAAQDAFCLAMRLSAVACGDLPNIDVALSEYESIRRPHTTKITLGTRKAGLMYTTSWPYSIARDLFVSRRMADIFTQSLLPVV